MGFEQDLTGALKRTANGMHAPASLENRVLTVWRENSRQQSNRNIALWRKTAALASACVLLLLGGPLAVGLRSPDAARVLSHIPVIGSILNLFGVPYLTVPGVSTAVDHGFGIPVGQSVTDHGITLTIQNAYYDRRQVWWGMTESFGPNAPSRPAMSSHDALAYMNGRLIGVNAKFPKLPLKIRGELQGGDFQPASGGRYVGIVGDFLDGLHPPVAHMTVLVRQVGSVNGDWTFRFRLSSARIGTATRTVHPMISKHAGGVTLTVDRVTEDPATIVVEGTLSAPAALKGTPQFVLQALDQRGRTIGVGQPGTNGNIGSGSWGETPIVRDGRKTWHFYTYFNAPARKVTMMRLVPYAEPMIIGLSLPPHSKSFAPGSRVSYLGTGEAITFTRVEYLPHATRVYYETKGDQFAQPNFYDLELLGLPLGPGRPGPKNEAATGHAVVNAAEHLAYLEFPAVQHPLEYTLIQGPVNKPFFMVQPALAMKGLAMDIALR